MSDVQLNDAFFQKAAGWEAVQHARALLASGKVLSSNWTPPMLKGVVQAGDTSYRAGLVIQSAFDVENICTCRPAREDGIICAHSVAVGLHHLKPPSPKPGGSLSGPAGASSSGTRVVTKDPLRLTRDPAGQPLAIQIIFPPNLAEACSRGRVMLVFEGTTRSGRTPLNALVRSGGFALDAADTRLLDGAEQITGGDTPGMVQLPLKDFVALLPALAGHPRLTLGRGQPLQILATPAPLALRADLNAAGEIVLRAKAGSRMPTLIGDGAATWSMEGATLRPFGMAAELREAFAGTQTIPRSRVPAFLSTTWPRLIAAGGLEASFRPEDFELVPRPPEFLLQLAGGLAQLTGTLQCAYGPRIMTVGVTSPDESTWMADPTHPRRYSTRDAGAEHEAVLVLRQAGFTGPSGEGRWQLIGQDRVVAFFARDYPRLQRRWKVTLEERLDRSTRTQLERVQPRLEIRPSGEQWFDLEVNYSTGDGETFSAADIQQLLRGGSRRLRNGRLAIIDSGAVEELQEVLLDCAPEQAVGTGQRYHMSQTQAGFLESSLRNQGLTFSAPAAWQDRVRRQTGEATLTCPPLGELESVLRPYQQHGVAWMSFLRENGFGGVLADEMGLGKTVQVLALFQAVLARKPGRLAPFLVICPTSLVFNWAAEAARFTPGIRVGVVSGPDRSRALETMAEFDLVITSYALARRDAAHYRAMEFDTVVLDEAQHIKNRATQNAQTVKAIRARHRLILTGTPLENSVADLWSLFDFLMPGYLGSSDDFRERYEVAISRERDAGALQRLGRRIRPFLLRRLKRDVVKELPDKIEQTAYCELTREQSGVYQQLLAHTRKEVLESVGEQGLARGRMLVLTALLRLRQVCCDLRLLKREPAAGTPASNPSNTDLSAAEPTREPSGKVQLFGELLDEVLDGGHRALVFSQFTSMLGLLREELEARGITSCYLDGSTTDRAAVVTRFQSDASIPVFLISLKAGGVGLNLTGADTVIHFDPWWNPAVEDQATDRAHRIGQAKVVTSYKLITRGTIEEKILNLQRKKREVIAATLTGEEAFTSGLSWDEIRELLE